MNCTGDLSMEFIAGRVTKSTCALFWSRTTKSNDNLFMISVNSISWLEWNFSHRRNIYVHFKHLNLMPTFCLFPWLVHISVWVFRNSNIHRRYRNAQWNGILSEIKSSHYIANRRSTTQKHFPQRRRHIRDNEIWVSFFSASTMNEVINSKSLVSCFTS